MSCSEVQSQRKQKSQSAFRTISEVSKELGVQQHVLRFWESRFDAIQPMKRGGGRRYYRPEDVTLLQTIRDRLYNDGFTIKGVQRILAEKGTAAFVAEASLPPEAIATNHGDLQAEPGLPLDLPTDTSVNVAPSKAGLSERHRKEILSAIHELETLKMTLDQTLETTS